MNTKRLIFFYGLATAVSLATWMIALLRLNPKSEARSWILEIAYPVSFGAGVAVLTGLAQRVSCFQDRHGKLSLLRVTALTVFTLILSVFGMIYGKGILPLFCFYIVLVSLASIGILAIVKNGL